MTSRLMAETLGIAPAQTCKRHRGQQGFRRSSTRRRPTPSWRAQALPTRPEQPSLASVGGGMAAGAAFTHPRAADPRASGPSDLFQPYVTQMCILLGSCNAPL